MERTEKTIEVNAPVGVVFGLYSDFERFPEWMKSVKEVRKSGERMTRWTAEAPLMNVEWEAETIAFEENRKLAWRTVRGDVQMEGEVTFEDAGDGKTRMHFSLNFEPPAGRLGSLVAHLMGSDPAAQVEEDLKRFAQLAEKQAAEKGDNAEQQAA